jgi:hypothetical protein
MESNNSVHFEPIVYTVRFYSEGCSYENGDPYVAVLTAQVISKDSVYISGMLGKINGSMMKNLLSSLYALGFKKIIAVRGGAVKEYKFNWDKLAK